MTSAQPTHPTAPPYPGARPDHLSAGSSIRSWLLTTDHRRLALLYLVSLTLVFLGGALAAGLLRLELITPAGDLLSADAFNRTFSLHGIVMVWMFLVPAIPAVLGTFALPRLVGARNLALPRIALLSWWLYGAGVFLLLVTALQGGVDTGWTFAVPLATAFSHSAVLPAAGGIALAALASILLSLTFLVTVHRERGAGVAWLDLSLFAWSIYATAWIVVLSTPVLLTALLALMLERGLGLGLFDPTLGGDPLLFRHLFWFATRPALYIMVLPALGVASDAIAAAAGRPVRGRRVVVASFGAIAVLGFFTWGVHLSTGGGSPLLVGLSSLMATILVVPFGLVLLHWLKTLRTGGLRLEAATAWSLGLFVLLVLGGAAGVAISALGVDVHLHGTLFVTGHVHLLALGVVMAFLAGLHLWWPEITGRRALDPGVATWSKGAALLTVLGALLTFGPQIWLGVLGLPRRQWSYPAELQVYQVFSTAGATILAVGLLMPVALLLWAARTGRPATPAGERRRAAG